jgi:uncharacterized damage-inducible protein DinB
MITPAFAQAMAAYNAWQNRSLYGAAAALPDEARRQDRGAFFKSIHGTLNHILWGDRIWMSRFDNWPKPEVPIGESPRMIDDFAALRTARVEADAKLADWAARLDQAALEGDLTWYSGISQVERTKPRALLVTHMFNHQTHHRGQVHAMLTAAGAKPEATDLPWMPEG